MSLIMPNHLAIVMDGNGRWASARGLPKIEGHKEGALRAEEIILEAKNQGITHLTLYAFSTENWGRDQNEIQHLLDLISRKITADDDFFERHDIRMRVLGEINSFPKHIGRALEQKIADTQHHSGLQVNFCLSYGGQQDIVQATQHLIRDWMDNGRDPEDLTANDFMGALSSQGLPPVDFFIRTSGELRISNFLLWELAYAELYFTTTLWPDFTDLHLRSALHSFSRRNRRFGK